MLKCLECVLFFLVSVLINEIYFRFDLLACCFIKIFKKASSTSEEKEKFIENDAVSGSRYTFFGCINSLLDLQYFVPRSLPCSLICLNSLSLLSGTGYAAVFINISVENFAGWKYSLTFSIIQKSYIAGFLVYILINLALVFSSVCIITQFAPAAAGSGIPEIKGYLNGKCGHLSGLLFKTLLSLLVLETD